MQKTIERHIAAVTGQLRPETAVSGSYLVPRSLAERMAFYRTPGVSIAVVNDFRVEWARGFGLRQAGRAGRVNARTLFQAASISKPIFGLAVMRLFEEGRLDLDRDVNSYLTSWQVPASGGWQPHITLRQLLSHSAGVNLGGFPGYPAGTPLPSTLQVLNGRPPANTEPIRVDILPGLQYRYSGGGFIIAQQAVADVVGQPIGELIRELVLAPLGMNDSTFAQPLPRALAGRAACAHPYGGAPLPGKWNVYPELAAAGLWTTAGDLARMGAGLMNAMHGRPGSLLSQESLKIMLSAQPAGPGLPPPAPPMGHQISWPHEQEYAGLAFRLAGSGAQFHFGHSGTNAGFVSIMNFYPDLGKGAAVMLNSEAYDLFNEIFAVIAREYEWPDFMPPEKLAFQPVDLAPFAGEYRGPVGERLRLQAEGGVLRIQLENQPPVDLVAASELEFYTQGLNASVAFEKDERGKILSLTISQQGRSFKATRLD